MPAPAAAVTAARVGALAWSERRRLIWVLVVALGVPLALVAVIAALVGGLAGELDGAPSVDGFAPSQAALADVPPLYLQTYQAVGAGRHARHERLRLLRRADADLRDRRLPGRRAADTGRAGGAGRHLENGRRRRKRRRRDESVGSAGRHPRRGSAVER